MQTIDPEDKPIFFDIETTDATCEISKMKILEIAVRVVDKKFNPLDAGLSLLVHWDEDLDQLKCSMPEAVIKMHTDSGLFNAYTNTPQEDRLSLAEVEDKVCGYLTSHGYRDASWKRGIMAGAGVACDRAVVREHMKKLDKLFHYHICDTTSTWHIVKRHYGWTKRSTDVSKHRAMDDINGSIRGTARAFRTLLKPAADVHWPPNGM